MPGRGSEGELGEGRYLIGSLRWLAELGLDLGPLRQRAEALQEQGATVSALVQTTPQGLCLLALMAFGDEAKPGAAQALARLRARGIQTVMISGDNRGAAEAMARQLGLRPEAGEVMAEVLPGDKAAPVVFYCNAGECWKSYKASVVAIRNGWKQIFWFRGGMPEWKGKGYPVE